MSEKECLYFFARRWRRGDGHNTRDATGSKTVASRGCAMTKFANLRTRSITQVARFGASVNVYAVLMISRPVPYVLD
ncbi:hypothetical protein Y032_0016g2941 [Ancylostoma ceylanicum]|uniref:Uncharacterized protein n=1 Tax=Ancylostoma ceylanicum TaxID=53326 RepID=A0A016V7R9_9BILA|nr:hypothetical protein Y032_0016g2941 [Ancylostoma ceylanicum]